MRSGRGDLPEVEIPYETVWAEPTGPEVTVPYLGAQKTFIQRRDDLLPANHRKLPHLMHHVPFNKRGYYKLLDGEQQLDERLHPSSYALCNGMVQTTNNRGERNPDNLGDEPRPCKAKAINYSGFCSRHGGMLHPLDRKRIDWDKAPREIKFKFGKLSVDDLDDEELSRGQIRKADGSFTANNYVSAEIHDKMVKKLFERADEKLRDNLLTAVDTFAEIAKGTAYEPADRLKAAEFIFTRLRGKVPTEVVVSQEKPFEMVLTDVLTGGSRAESRARRGLEIEDGNTVDAEFVEEVFEALDEELDAEQDSEEPEPYVPEDHIPLRAEFLPKIPKLTGPAGRTEEAPVPPTSLEHRVPWDKQNEANKAEAAKKEDDWLKDAKAFRKKMHAKRAQRIAVRDKGYANLPIPYEPEVIEYDDEPGQQYMVFKKKEGMVSSD